MWSFRMPADYASAPVLKVQYKMASATTGNVIIEGRLAAVSDGDATDVDAKAFGYQRPMSRLRYRTVFDVAPGDNWLTSWIGESSPSPGSVILVDPGELSRFARTYRALPPVPQDVLDRPEPFILDR